MYFVLTYQVLLSFHVTVMSTTKAHVSCHDCVNAAVFLTLYHSTIGLGKKLSFLAKSENIEFLLMNASYKPKASFCSSTSLFGYK